MTGFYHTILKFPELGPDIYFTEQVFGTPVPYVTAAEATLAQSAANYWAKFAMSGDPNGRTAMEVSVSWPKFTTAGDTILRMDLEPQGGGIKAQQGLRMAACDWQTKLAHAMGIPGA